VIHRFIELVYTDVPEPNIVFLTRQDPPGLFYSLWKAGNLATPVRMDETVISASFGINDHLGDPERSPDGTEVVYSRVGHNLTPKKSSVRKVDWADTTDVELYSETGGDLFPLSPTWKPDGSKILFRAKGGTSQLRVIKHMDPDGTNVATLHTGASGVVDPLYNYDGTLIAFTENGNIKVMNADGTGLATITSSGDSSNVAWANTQNVLAFIDVSGSAGWRKINADGTGLTTLSTDWAFGTHSIPIKWSWLPDDSAIVTLHYVAADPSPNRHVALIAADGSGTTQVSPQRSAVAATADTRPAVFFNRIYFYGPSGLASVALDGSDYRVDFDGTAETPDVTFHGFKGDSVNV